MQGTGKVVIYKSCERYSIWMQTSRGRPSPGLSAVAAVRIARFGSGLRHEAERSFDWKASQRGEY